MKTENQLLIAPDPPAPMRATMNGKPVHLVPGKSIINMHSGFAHKLLCDGPTFSPGSACVYSCAFCYVPDIMRKTPHLVGITAKHENVVIRRNNAVAAARAQLTFANGKPRFDDPQDRRTIYASPLVDVAGNMELARETAEICRLILALTHWEIRLLSKSNLLPKIAEALEGAPTLSGKPARERVIYGVSTGTLDDGLARAIEGGTPLVSKRIASLHWLQDNGFRTFGMICPSLPDNPLALEQFARKIKAAIRAEKCEHVWAEVINARGDSMARTVAALEQGGHAAHAARLRNIAGDAAEWEYYARATFAAHVGAGYKPGQLRFLQYVTKASRAFWTAHESKGAILL